MGFYLNLRHVKNGPYEMIFLGREVGMITSQDREQVLSWAIIEHSLYLDSMNFLLKIRSSMPRLVVSNYILCGTLLSSKAKFKSRSWAWYSHKKTFDFHFTSLIRLKCLNITYFVFFYINPNPFRQRIEFDWNNYCWSTWHIHIRNHLKSRHVAQ